MVFTEEQMIEFLKDMAMLCQKAAFAMEQMQGYKQPYRQQEPQEGFLRQQKDRPEMPF